MLRGESVVPRCHSRHFARQQGGVTLLAVIVLAILAGAMAYGGHEMALAAWRVALSHSQQDPS